MVKNWTILFVYKFNERISTIFNHNKIAAFSSLDNITVTLYKHNALDIWNHLFKFICLYILLCRTCTLKACIRDIVHCCTVTCSRSCLCNVSVHSFLFWIMCKIREISVTGGFTCSIIYTRARLFWIFGFWKAFEMTLLEFKVMVI